MPDSDETVDAPQPSAEDGAEEAAPVVEAVESRLDSDGEASEAAAPVEAAEGAAQAESEPAPARARTRAPARPRQRASRSRQAAADEAAPAAEANGLPPPRLLEIYRNEVVPTMMGEMGITNPLRIPRLQKITLNIGLGEALTNSRAMEAATRDLATISGQKPIITRARKSIAGFKLREGNPIGTCVTLRGARMYHFFDRLVNAALPRIRDFRGISRRGFDGRGNFTIGIREQIIFPEIDYNEIDRIRGLQVTINTTAQNDAEGMRLLELFGVPFVRQE